MQQAALFQNHADSELSDPAGRHCLLGSRQLKIHSQRGGGPKARKQTTKRLPPVKQMQQEIKQIRVNQATLNSQRHALLVVSSRGSRSLGFLSLMLAGRPVRNAMSTVMVRVPVLTQADRTKAQIKALAVLIVYAFSVNWALKGTVKVLQRFRYRLGRKPGSQFAGLQKKHLLIWPDRRSAKRSRVGPKLHRSDPTFGAGPWPCL